MSTLINRLARISFAAAMLASGLLAAQQTEAASVRTQPNGAARFYDDGGFDRGYSWCKSGGAAIRCDYFTLEQCRAASLPSNTCVRNPFSYEVRMRVQQFRPQ
jgi:hypothetical protein